MEYSQLHDVEAKLKISYKRILSISVLQRTDEVGLLGFHHTYNNRNLLTDLREVLVQLQK